MAAILRVRDNNGNITEIPAIVGPAGETITSFQRTNGNGAPGTNDTYAITTSKGKVYTFQIHNGRDGGMSEDAVRELVAAEVAGIVVRFDEVWRSSADGGPYYVADKTYAEVAEALNAGTQVVGLSSMGEDYPTHLFPVVQHFLDNGFVEFGAVGYDDDNKFVHRGYRLLANDTVESLEKRELASVADVDRAVADAEPEIFVVTFSADYTTTPYTYSADKDQLEVDEALAAGKIVIGKDNLGYLTLIGDLRRTGYDNTYTFSRVDVGDGQEECYYMYGGGVQWDYHSLEAAGTAASAVSTHNTDTSAHSDIREAVAAKAPMYGYGPEDLTAGSSPLESDKLHFVYE